MDKNKKKVLIKSTVYRPGHRASGKNDRSLLYVGRIDRLSEGRRNGRFISHYAQGYFKLNFTLYVKRPDTFTRVRSVSSESATNQRSLCHI